MGARELKNKLSELVSASMDRLFRSIPLFGGLASARRSSITAAVREVFITTLFSTLPIWLFPTLFTIGFLDASSWTNNVYSAVSQGDLYVYSSALIGPLIFAITVNYADWDKENRSPSASRLGSITFAFPYGVWFVLISLLVAMVSVICFTLMRFESAGFITARLNYDSLVSVSMWIYLVSLICLFLVSVYRNDLSNPKIDDSAKSFIEEWNNRDG
jgi:hypothetical protein